MTSLPLRWGASPVPWVAAWSPEESRDSAYIRTEIIGGHRLRVMCDGIDTPGVGRPVFKVMHLERSRHVVINRLCQICCEPLPSTSICMNQGERDGYRPLINDGLPMCEPCALLSLNHCPGLKRAVASGRLQLFRATAWDLAPVILGQVPESAGGIRRVNDLLAKERGPVFGYVIALHPIVGSPEARVSGLLLCTPSLDRRKLEFPAYLPGDGLGASPGICSDIGALLPIAPCGRSSL